MTQRTVRALVGGHRITVFITVEQGEMTDVQEAIGDALQLKVTNLLYDRLRIGQRDVTFAKEGEI
jgi:hypothetical protein